MFPRLASHAADAPYLGEAAILYFLTVQPAPGSPRSSSGEVPGLARIGLLLFFGVPLFAWGAWLLALRRGRRAAGRVEGTGPRRPGS